MATPSLQGLTTDGDNYVLLQSALNEGELVLPAGVFPYSRALVPPIAAVVDGVNSYRSVLLQTTPGQSGMQMTDAQRLTLRGVGFTASANSTAPGISITREVAPNTFGMQFTDVALQNFGDGGINGPSANLILSAFKRLAFTNIKGRGLSIAGVSGGSAGTSTEVSSCYAVGCTKAGYVLDKMNYSLLSANGCDSCGAGYVIVGCQGITLDANGCEGIAATGTDIFSDGTCFRIDSSNGVKGGGNWTYANSHLVLHVSGESANIDLGIIGENSPLPTAIGYALVDSGSQIS
jgi:hypothetical protein